MTLDFALTVLVGMSPERIAEYLNTITPWAAERAAYAELLPHLSEEVLRLYAARALVTLHRCGVTFELPVHARPTVRCSPPR